MCMKKETKETNRSLSFQELREKITYIHYVVCRKKTLKEYRCMKMNSDIMDFCHHFQSDGLKVFLMQ